MLDVQPSTGFMFKWFGNGSGMMAVIDDQDDALARLESALDRIARHAEAAEEPAFDPAPVAARLDRLIAAVRAGLAEPAAEV